MNMSAPVNPDKANAARFEAVGVRPDVSKPFDWYVVDRGRAEALGGVEIAHCDADQATAKESAERIAYALNLAGRLLGDPAHPYYVDEVDRLAESVLRVANQTTARSMQAMGMGETDVAVTFGAEARVIAVAADMLRRMLAELLKFSLVGDTVEAQAAHWIATAFPNVTRDRTDIAVPAVPFLDALDRAYRAGAIAGMTRGFDVVSAGMVAEKVCRDVAELDGETEDESAILSVLPDTLALIVRRALGVDQ